MKHWPCFPGCLVCQPVKLKEEAMKVRVKGHEVAFEVVEESANYYILKDNFADRGGKFLGAKADYEPVQEWVDVTHECTLEASAHGTYCIFRLGYVINTGNTCHRVTCTGSTFKVEVLK